MTGVLEAAGELQQFCQQHQWRFCFIGGLAVQRWGEARFTKHADLTLFTGIGEEEKFIDALVARFQQRGSVDREQTIGAAWAARARRRVLGRLSGSHARAGPPYPA